MYQIDFSSTRALYADSDGWCGCIYCENYYCALPKYHPEAVKALNDLGLRHDRALEIADCFWDETGKKRIYQAYYPVIGTLATDELEQISSTATLTLYRHDSPKLFCPTPKTEPPYFVAVLTVSLPWEMPSTPDE